MAQNIFSAMELDAIGEMMNISLGSSATAVSNLLDHRVDITTPKVTVVPISELPWVSWSPPSEWKSSMSPVWKAAILCC